MEDEQTRRATGGRESHPLPLGILLMDVSRRKFLLGSAAAVWWVPAAAQTLKPVKLLLVRRPGLGPTNQCVAPCIRGRLYNVSDIADPLEHLMLAGIVGRTPICDVLERPQNNNLPKSSIPKGVYPAFSRTDNPENKEWLKDPAKAWRLELKNTSPRSLIQLHFGANVNVWSVGCFIVGTALQTGDAAGITDRYCTVKDSEKALVALRAVVESPGSDPNDLKIAVIDDGDLFAGMTPVGCP